jgi:diguanylate cyclase (GGDEF)-like protein
MRLALPAVLHSPVARRLMMMFLLSALLPLALIAVVSLSQVRELLLYQGDQRLAATAKGFGLSVFERLVAARDVLASIAANPSTATGPLGDRMFRALVTEDASGGRTAVVGTLDVPALTAEARARLAKGQSIAIVRGGEPSTVVIGVAGSRGEAWIGQVRTRYLWGGLDELPSSTDLCVVEDGSRAILFCYAPGGSGELRSYSTRAADGSDTATWQRDAQTHRARAWALFMKGTFDTADWVVVASQPEELPLARLIELRRVYIPAVLLALVLGAWFTLRQSKSIVEPLGHLARRAREIAAGRFSGKLEMRRDDEFGELASAFDAMSTRLGQQFASMRGLSEIDALILSGEDTTQVIRTVVQRMLASTGARIVTLTTFELGDEASLGTYSWAGGEGGSFLFDKKRARPGELSTLALEPAWHALPLPDPWPTWLSHPDYRKLGGALTQPIVWQGKPHGVIVLGYESRELPPAEEMQHVRDMADRMAVAVSSAWRDEQIYQRTHFDPLTGAPNRLLFTDRVGVEITRGSREGTPFGVLVVNLDRFKGVNESFGHAVGDIVLREAHARVLGCIRAEDTLARLGSDEFAVLLANLVHPQEAFVLSQAILTQMAREFRAGEHHLFLGASIGIASFPADGASAGDLLKSADTAMHRAKEGGRSQAVFFEERMNAEVVAALTLDRDLRGALDRGELHVHYQPQLDLASGRVVAAEALLRWFHPTRGSISPARFIPLAEESGFIEPLGEWIFEQVCTQLAAWRSEGLAIEHVAVNVSPRQLRRRDFAETVAACARKHEIPASALQIEITEGLLLDRSPAVEQVLRELDEAGYSLALDDFGTGFSSMAYLERLPVDTLKIDQTFVRNLALGKDSRAIVTAIIAMAGALGKAVVAEGVETETQAQILRVLGCDRIQGFLLSPAVDAAAFSRIAREAPKPVVLVP